MSYKSVKQIIQDFANLHCFVSEFQAEQMDGVSLREGTNYPLVFFNPLGENKEKDNYSYKVQLYIIDYAKDDKFESKEYCVQKCHKIASDLYNYLRKIAFRNPNAFTINSEFNFMRDKAHGVSIDFDIIDNDGCVSSLNDVLCLT